MNKDVISLKERIIMWVDDDNDKIKRVSNKDVMLYRKDAQMIKVNSVIKVGIIGNTYLHFQFPKNCFGKILEWAF